MPPLPRLRQGAHGYTCDTQITLKHFHVKIHQVLRRLTLSPLGPNDGQAYPFMNAFNFRQAPLRPTRMIYRKWPRDAYHVNLAEGHDDT